MLEKVHAVETKAARRVSGYFEAVFDVVYLGLALAIGIYILRGATQQAQLLAGTMALVLAAGDAFHLVPRIAASIKGSEQGLQKALAFGKLVTSLTMTVFYVLLWHVGILMFSPANALGWTAVVYALAALRIALCLSKKNGWYDNKPPMNWAVYRNIPFLLLGIMVAVLFGVYAQNVLALRWMWLAIALSFAFYIPVILFANKYRMLGMLMIPKTCAYLWILFMCVSI